MHAALRVVAGGRTMIHPRQKLRNLVTALKKDGAASLVLLALVGRLDESDRTHVSAVGIARDTGLCERTVRAALAKLRRIGVVTEWHDRGRSTGRTVNLDVFDSLPATGASPLQPAAPPPLQLVAPLQPIAGETPAACCTPPLQPAAPEVQFQRSACKEQHPQPPQPPPGEQSAEQEPSPAAPPPAASPPGLAVVPDVENPSETAPPPARKKRVGIRRKREFPPEAHRFVESFREDFRDNVQADYEFRVPIPDSELAAAQALARDAPAEVLQTEKAWFLNDKRETVDGKGFPGWAFVIRSVANWRDKREKIRNAMRFDGVL
jgi:hypothetical protein